MSPLRVFVDKIEPLNRFKLPTKTRPSLVNMSLMCAPAASSRRSSTPPRYKSAICIGSHTWSYSGLFARVVSRMYGGLSSDDDVFENEGDVIAG
jgi:hypothetical protein